MNSNKVFDRIVAVLALIASIVAAFYAYRSYNQDYQPVLAFNFYTVDGDKETNTDSIKIVPNKLKHDKGFMEMDLPLRAVNSSEADANKMTLWVGPQIGDTHQIELLQNGCGGWRVGKMRQQNWFTRDAEHLPPNSSMTDGCFKVRVKEDVQELKLSWQILASRTWGKMGI